MSSSSDEAKHQANTTLFLKNALDDRVVKGPTSQVYRLVDKQLRKRSDLTLTRRLYVAIAAHVTQVVEGSGDFEGLIAAFFSFDFVVKGGQGPDASAAFVAAADAARDAFASAARSLVSANATLAAPCLRMLCRSLQTVSLS